MTAPETPREAGGAATVADIATPGVWFASAVRTKFGDQPVITIDSEADWGTFAYVLLGRTDEEFRRATADARLMAASKDLYEALWAAKEELRLIRMKDHGTVYNPALSTQIALAILKAEGRQP